MTEKMQMKSLFLKLSIPVLTVFVVVTIGLVIFIPGQLKTNTVDSSVESASQVVSQYKALRKYYVANIIKKVLKSSDIKPAINHKDNPKAIPLPATLIHDLSKLSEKSGMRINLYSGYPFPNRKNRKQKDGCISAGSLEICTNKR